MICRLGNTYCAVIGCDCYQKAYFDDVLHMNTGVTCCEKCGLWKTWPRRLTRTPARKCTCPEPEQEALK